MSNRKQPQPHIHTPSGKALFFIFLHVWRLHFFYAQALAENRLFYPPLQHHTHKNWADASAVDSTNSPDIGGIYDTHQRIGGAAEGRKEAASLETTHTEECVYSKRGGQVVVVFLCVDGRHDFRVHIQIRVHRTFRSFFLFNIYTPTPTPTHASHTPEHLCFRRGRPGQRR